jgi:NADH-quinone oxidoreductase subunit G
MTAMEDLITIEVDGVELQARKGQMLIEVTDNADLYIPRFCYHKKLSVAANCRMCLVEVERAPKPVPACATPVMPGMKVKTRSPKALDAQKGTMEFLLINHPLDCPICDQGGECELQDLAVGYGSSVSRYTEGKRVVADKDIGPLIRTDMTRCIHCTRCVRFGEEIAGMRELGATGRGEHMEIGTYVASTVTSELSGNVIDVCPVGALTSRPYRYTARAWELRAYPAVSPHDAVGSNLWVHAKGARIKRVLPRENEAVNEVWIADRDRYSYEGLYAADRLHGARIRDADGWHEADLTQAINYAADGLAALPGERLGVLCNATATNEEAFLLARLAETLGTPHRDARLQQWTTPSGSRLEPGIGMNLDAVAELQAGLLLGCHLRHEAPMLNHRLRKAALRGGEFATLGATRPGYNWPVAEQWALAPALQMKVLAGIVRAVLDFAGTELDGADPLAQVIPAANEVAVARRLYQAPEALVLLGAEATRSPCFGRMVDLLRRLADLPVRIGWLPAGPNPLGVYCAGMLPAGPAGLSAAAQFAQGLEGWLLLNCEPEADTLLGSRALARLEAARFNVLLTPWLTPAMQRYAHVVLPSAIYAENEGSLLNVEGLLQAQTQVVKPAGEARPAWRLLRALGARLRPESFAFASLAEVTAAGDAGGAAPVAGTSGQDVPLAPVEAGSLQWLPGVAMYRTDGLVRRAPALQATPHAGEAGLLALAPASAAALHLQTGDRVVLDSAGAACGQWVIRVDSGVAEGVVIGDVTHGLALPEPGATVMLSVVASAAATAPAAVD